MAKFASFEEFCKMGTHPIVKAHYSGEQKGEKGFEALDDPKDQTEKGGGVEHTEKAAGADLSNPKPPTK